MTFHSAPVRFAEKCLRIRCATAFDDVEVGDRRAGGEGPCVDDAELSSGVH